MRFLVFLSMAVACLAAGNNVKKEWTWQLNECGKTANNDYPSQANKCLNNFTAVVDGNSGFFTSCDKDYCDCASNGTTAWNSTASTCHLKPEDCGIGCGCLRKCYKPFMNCTWSLLTAALNNIQDCHTSKMYSCILDTHDAFVEECKVGVRTGRISWSNSPVPKTCTDNELENKICAGATLSPYTLLLLVVVIASFVVV